MDELIETLLARAEIEAKVTGMALAGGLYVKAANALEAANARIAKLEASAAIPEWAMQSDDQEWTRVSPSVAFHLIERHAENWAHAGQLMEAWRLAVNAAALEAQIAAAEKQEPVAWMLEWTHSGEVREQRLYDDERHCLLDAEKDGGVCVALGRIAAPLLSDGWRKDAETLREALKDLSDMYGSTWDRTDGALVTFDIERFEAAHAKAIAALAKQQGQ
jgi:hypothetical protein